MNNLYDFTIDFLGHYGAIVEGANDALEVVSPADLARALGIKEYSNLVFSADKDKKDGTFISFDSETFKKFPEVFKEEGKFSAVSVSSPQIRVEKIKKRIADKIIFNNAIFSIGENEEKAISYLLACFKFTAFSDERREGIVSILINEFNLSSRKFRIEQLDILTDISNGHIENIQRQDNEKVFGALGAAPKELINEELEDFLKSVHRRLNRDTRRVHEYYYALICETRQFIKKKFLAGEEKRKAIDKIKAIETELKWKINDLIAKYKIEIRIEPISFIRVETIAPLFWLTIKRRKKIRLFPLTYNPLLKTFDNLPCESCFNPGETHWVCDEQLHITCGKCFRTCQKCGKSYCGACHKLKCPKCGFAYKTVIGVDDFPKTE